jgi:hypothetical protein
LSDETINTKVELGVRFSYLAYNADDCFFDLGVWFLYKLHAQSFYDLLTNWHSAEVSITFLLCISGSIALVFFNLEIWCMYQGLVDFRKKTLDVHGVEIAQSIETERSDEILSAQIIVFKHSFEVLVVYHYYSA